MKEKIYAQNLINRVVDEFILNIAECYNSDWKKISFEQYVNLVRDRVLKQLVQLEKETSDEWND